MENKKTVDEKLEDTFNLPKSVGDIIESEPLVVTPIENRDVATTDFEAVRSNLYSIIEKAIKQLMVFFMLHPRVIPQEHMRWFLNLSKV